MGGKINFIRFKGFPAAIRAEEKITPYVILARISPAKSAKLSYAGDNSAQITRLRAAGAYDLPSHIISPPDAFWNGGIEVKDWFFHNAEKMRKAEIQKHSGARAMIISNGGNAPLHEWEANYCSEQDIPLVSRDFEVKNGMIAERQYFCVTYDPAKGVGIDYVKFRDDGTPHDAGLKIAIGGRPLVSNGKAVPIEEILKTSISDPRHVILLPEIRLSEKTYMPLGIRTIQEELRCKKEGDIIDKINRGVPILISLEKERACWGKAEITEKDIIDSMAICGYGMRDFNLNIARDTLHIKLKPNLYRHTFWAKRGDDIFIGIICNDLPENIDNKYDAKLYTRYLKPTGLSIEQLQDYLVSDLHAESAVLMGNGRDCRIFVPKMEQNDRENCACKAYHDNDVVADRSNLTSGLLSIII